MTVNAAVLKTHKDPIVLRFEQISFFKKRQQFEEKEISFFYC